MIEAATETSDNFHAVAAPNCDRPKRKTSSLRLNRHHSKLYEIESSVHRSSTPRGPLPDGTDFFSPTPPIIDDASIVTRD